MTYRYAYIGQYNSGDKGLEKRSEFSKLVESI
jgi:hypothetical protein